MCVMSLRCQEKIRLYCVSHHSHYTRSVAPTLSCREGYVHAGTTKIPVSLLTCGCVDINNRPGMKRDPTQAAGTIMPVSGSLLMDTVGKNMSLLSEILLYLDLSSVARAEQASKSFLKAAEVEVWDRLGARMDIPPLMVQAFGAVPWVAPEMTSMPMRTQLRLFHEARQLAMDSTCSTALKPYTTLICPGGGSCQACLRYLDKAVLRPDERGGYFFYVRMTAKPAPAARLSLEDVRSTTPHQTLIQDLHLYHDQVLMVDTPCLTIFEGILPVVVAHGPKPLDVFHHRNCQLSLRGRTVRWPAFDRFFKRDVVDAGADNVENETNHASAHLGGRNGSSNNDEDHDNRYSTWERLMSRKMRLALFCKSHQLFVTVVAIDRALYTYSLVCSTYAVMQFRTPEGRITYGREDIQRLAAVKPLVRLTEDCSDFQLIELKDRCSIGIDDSSY